MARNLLFLTREGAAYAVTFSQNTSGVESPTVRARRYPRDKVIPSSPSKKRRLRPRKGKISFTRSLVEVSEKQNPEFSLT